MTADTGIAGGVGGVSGGSGAAFRVMGSRVQHRHALEVVHCWEKPDRTVKGYFSLCIAAALCRAGWRQGGGGKFIDQAGDGIDRVRGVFRSLYAVVARRLSNSGFSVI